MSGIAVQCLEAWIGSSEELPPAGLVSPSTSVLTFGSSKCSTPGAGVDFCLVFVPHPQQSDPTPQA